MSKNDETTRFKIIYTLISSCKPLKCSEIAKQVSIADNLCIWHLKNLVNDCIVVEHEDGYICQPFFIDKSIQDDLNALMKVVVKIILREIIIPNGYTKREIENTLLKNLETYIQKFAVDSL